jgi:hypothetical protein
MFLYERVALAYLGSLVGIDRFERPPPATSFLLWRLNITVDRVY